MQVALPIMDPEVILAFQISSLCSTPSRVLFMKSLVSCDWVAFVDTVDCTLLTRSWFIEGSTWSCFDGWVMLDVSVREKLAFVKDGKFRKIFVNLIL
jgi:hypothetical protein